jgi:hypothetical protein
MKIRLIALLPLLVVPFASAQTNVTSAPTTNTHALLIPTNRLDHEYGFREYKFEEPIASCKGLELIEDDPIVKFYSCKDEKLELNGAKLKTVDYGFYKGRLSTVEITSEPAPNGELLMKSMVAAYGPPTKSPHNPNKFYWFGVKVTADFMINDKGVASVDLWSNPMRALRAADSKSPKP